MQHNTPSMAKANEQPATERRSRPLWLWLALCLLLASTGWALRSGRYGQGPSARPGSEEARESAPAIQAAFRGQLQTPLTGDQARNADPALQDFEEWVSAYERTPTAVERSGLLKTGTVLAGRRAEALVRLMRTDPQAALKAALSAERLATLPETVRGQLEKRVTGMGDFQVVGGLPVPGARVPPYERYASLGGQTYRAHVYGERLRQTTQEQVPLEGVAVGDELALLDGPPAAVARSAWTEGAKTVLVMRCDFADLAGDPVSAASLQTLIDSTVNNFYVENSYGKTSLKGTVTSMVLRLPQSYVIYRDNFAALMNDARTAARANGYETNNFNLDIVACKYFGDGIAGRGYVGGKGSTLYGYFDLRVTAHELGHNYGAWHANYWTASGESVIGPGTNEEYGDSFDVMGPTPHHFNAYFKNLFNWLTATQVAAVGSSGTYRVYASDQALGSNIGALRITKDSDRQYWVSLRQRITGNKWLMNGADLHFDPWASSNGGTHLLDTTPGSSNGKNDSAVVIGRTFSDTAAGIHITPIGLGGTTPQSLDVVVNLGSFPGNSAPALALSASATAVAAGATVNFTATAADANGDPLAYFWDFGDNSFGTNSPNAAKSWGTVGEYLVRCTATDMKGGTASESVVVTVGAPATFRISGRVTEGGYGVEGVRVYVSTKMAWTDSDGSYDLVGLAAGSYTVSAIKYGFNLSAAFTNPVVVGPNASGIDFTALSRSTLTLTASDASASETGPNNGAFTVTRAGGSTNSALTVAYTLSGTASNGTDYSSIGSSVVIPSGSSSATVIITPIDDTLVEGSESVTLTLAANANYDIGSPSSGSVTISDNDTPPLPVVTVAATDALAAEPGSDTGLFTFTRTGSTSSSLTVGLTIGGTATNNKDYARINSTLTIPAGAASTTLALIPKDDTRKEGPETVLLTVKTSSAYNVGSPGSATVTISDNEAAGSSSSLSAYPDPAVEGELVTFTFGAETQSGVTFTWNFGDGTTLTTRTASVTHTYVDGEAPTATTVAAVKRDHAHATTYHVTVTATHPGTGVVATGALDLVVGDPGVTPETPAP